MLSCRRLVLQPSKWATSGAVGHERPMAEDDSSMARPRRPMLSRALIIETALEIIDREGLDALSTRRLATELAVRAPSLYNHFATKEEILDAVGDYIFDDVD